MAWVLFSISGRAAPPQPDPGALVIDPVQLAMEAAATVVGAGDAVVKFGDAVVDSVILTAETIRRTKALFRGTLKPSDFTISDTENPNERALKTYLNAIKGRLIPCGNHVAIKMNVELNVDGKSRIVDKILCEKVLVTCFAVPDTGANRAEAFKYTFTVTFDTPFYQNLRESPRFGDSVMVWEPLNLYEKSRDLTLRLARRAPRVEAMFPAPPRLSVEKGFPFLLGSCDEFPRKNRIEEIQAEITNELQASEVNEYLEILSTQGDSDAKYILAMRLLSGSSTNSPTMSKAFSLLKTAADGRNGFAALQLSAEYDVGTKIPRDRAKAIEYAEKAIKEGFISEKVKGYLDDLRKLAIQDSKPVPKQQ